MDRRVFEECILNKVSIYGDEFNNSELSLWAEQELEWCRSKGIDIILYDDVKYPVLLKECEDAPRLLYYKGNCDLNGEESLSIVGTRLASYYGRESCDSIIKSFTDNTFSPVIVSGLAYGVDVSAHRAALKYNLNTIAVLPCGLDEIYPSSHRDIASRIVKQGAIITEFPKGTPPIRRNFIRRNRIIAGISQGTLIVESRVKGGSMVTVELASSYGREIFALPGRVTDINSYGNNYLISKNIANIYLNDLTIPTTLGWQKFSFGSDISKQVNLFSSVNDDKNKVLLLLKNNKTLDINSIVDLSGINFDKLSIILLDLELEGKIVYNFIGYSLRL